MVEQVYSICLCVVGLQVCCYGSQVSMHVCVQWIMWKVVRQVIYVSGFGVMVGTFYGRCRFEV